MPFNLLLLPLLGGFIFIRLWNRTRWYAVRAEKERLVIYASLSGLVFLCIAFLISTIPPFIPCVSESFCLPIWWNRHVRIEYSGVSFLAFLLGATCWWPLNNLWPFKRFWNKEREAERILVEEGSPFEQLLDKAMRRSRSVMITLKSGKVYVGFVASSVIPGSDQKNIQILPTISGYREKDKHRVNFTTYYARAYAEINGDIAQLP